MLLGVVARQDAGADDALLIIERHQHIAWARVANDGIGIRSGCEETPQVIAIDILDDERAARA